jgi:DNA invertase Pin-like site-specific DNA recombinase
MNSKITPDHLCRIAVVYVRQSTMAQVTGNLESQRRQYDLAGAAEKAGFASVTVIDDDLGRSGSGSVQRPGFERLVAMVCSGDVGAVYCIEASRLARNGRDWHHLIDLCALAGAVVIDPDGAYDPRLVNDRLLLGLKGTMSEYELSLLRQRGIAARDSKARRGEYRFMLPPGFCWSKAGKIEIDPDEHVVAAIRLVFAKFAELGSARQVFLWMRSAEIKMPVVLRTLMSTNSSGRRQPITVLCRFCTIRCMLEPTHSGGELSERGLLTGGRESSAGSTNLAKSGTFCCATIIPAISVGRTMRRIRSCFLRTLI